MKTLLRGISILSIIAGLGLAFNTLILGLGVPTPNVPIVLAFAAAYALSGLASFALFGGIAEILERLPEKTT